jgi:hypothetical protein
MNEYIVNAPKGYDIPNHCSVQEFQAWSVEAKRRRREFLAALKRGDVCIADLIDTPDKYLAKITVLQLLTAIRGKKTAERLCQELKIKPDKQVRALWASQWHRLIARVDGRRTA